MDHCPQSDCGRANNGYLTGVSCIGATGCMAAGQAAFGGGVYAPVAMKWDGTTWPLQTTPALPGGAGSFNGVSCSAVRMCMGVGTSGSASLTGQWNGTAWAIVPSPSPTGQSSVDLKAVSCIGPTWCMAAGEGYAGTYQTLVGTAWTIVPSPNLGSTGSIMLNKPIVGWPPDETGPALANTKSAADTRRSS